MKPQNKGIILYLDMLPVLKQLRPESCGKVLLEVLRYAAGEELTNGLNDCERIAFEFIRSQVERDMDKYQRQCEVNRENGRKGGRPAGRPGKEKTERFLEKPKKANTNTKTNKNTNTKTKTNTKEDTRTNKNKKTESAGKQEPDCPAPVPSEEPPGQAGGDSLSPRLDGEEESVWEEYRQQFLQECPSLPRPVPASQWTKERLRALKKLGVTPEQFGEGCRRAEASDFLSGRNGKWEGCSLDWLLCPGNWQKVMEGNYENRTIPEPLDSLGEGPSFDLDEYEKMTRW